MAARQTPWPSTPAPSPRSEPPGNARGSWSAVKMSAMRWLVILLVVVAAACKSGSGGGEDPAKIIAKYKTDVLAREADFAAITKMLDGHDSGDPAPIDP